MKYNLIFFVLSLSIQSYAHFSGDIRYRHEQYTERKSSKRIDEQRERIRARVSFKADVNKHVFAEIRLATGGASTTSTNETLDSGGENKDVNLDLAYIKLVPEGWGEYHLGKFKTPFFRPGKSDLMFDSDWTPEGMSASKKVNIKNINFFTNISRIWIDNEKDNADTILYAPQIGVILGKERRLTLGASLYHYSSSSKKDELENPYSVYQIFAEYSFPLLSSYETVIFADFIKNSDAIEANPKNDKAYMLGVKLKKEKWNLAYDYRWKESNSTPSTLDDGDSCNGNSGCKSHRVSLKKGLGQNVKVGITYYTGKKLSGIDKSSTYHKTHIDGVFKF